MFLGKLQSDLIVVYHEMGFELVNLAQGTNFHVFMYRYGKLRPQG